MTIKRTFDRNVPAALPKHRMLSWVSSKIPEFVDLTHYAGPVKDQGDEGACTAHAGSSAMEWIFRRYFGKEPVFSPQYLYAQELIAQGNFPQDEGSDGVTLCTTMIAKGCCEATLYPYVAGQITRPSAQQDENAAEYRLGAFHGLSNSNVVLSVLGDTTPWPVEIGFTVYDSFMSQSLAETGVMTVPLDSEKVQGGHEVLCLGYDICDEPKIRPAGCPPAVLIQNSWGSGWALGGRFWMPLAILDRADTDMKIAHAGHKW